MKTSNASIQSAILEQCLNMQKKRIDSVLEFECSGFAFLFVNKRKGIIIGGKRQNIKLAGKN
ncbi:MAG: hypothetical protein VYD14_09015 [SAR324 cluster bacterium]|jgi:hypothetical protein|nr:hypothetical protein [SAR324 cluster bacterium]MEC9461331.1 hypothetical protein [SAR324 cluster bacterium]